MKRGVGLSGAASVIVLAMAPSGVAAQSRRFDVPAQPAQTGIPLFAHQAGIQILASQSITDGRTINRVQGTMNVDAALRRLLSGTDIVPVRMKDAVVLKRRGALATTAIAATAWNAPLAATPQTQTTPAVAGATDQADPPVPAADDTGEDIIVRGIRTTLAKQAEIKRNADQVVDSIVAEDIGKFPDPTVAAALQRVPGVQVSVSANNEIVNPIIRGLGDILTTLNGREIFTAASRGFAFQDLPAEALAGADVYKTSSANLIEGGVAGVIDLKLHKAFDFKDLTISGTARGRYAPQADAVNPTVGLLAANRWDTGIGEIGALIDVSYAHTKYSRKTPFNDNLRALIQPVSGADGVVIPAAETYLNSNGVYERPQVNGSLQWQASDALQLYADGLYAGFRSDYANQYSLFDASSAQSITNIVTNDDCADYRTNGVFYDPNGTVSRLCTAKSYQANNTNALALTEAHRAKTDVYLLAGGFRYDQDQLHANTDVSFQKSTFIDDSFSLIIGKSLVGFTAQTDVKGGPAFQSIGTDLAAPDGYSAISLSENRGRSTGRLFTVKSDITYDLDGILKNIQLGGRAAGRKARFQGAFQGAGAPAVGGSTAIGGLGLPSDFLARVDYPNRINDGGQFLSARTSYMLDADIQRTLRTLARLSPDVPGYQSERGYDASEQTYAGYLQTKYEIPLSGAIVVDGLIGARYTRTDRRIAGSGLIFAPDGSFTVQAVNRKTSDTDILPNASARVRFGGGLQARLSYTKAIARPDFGSLNPGLSYTQSTSQYILNSGSGGNPDLKPQKSDAIDGTLEYYFSKSNYVSAAVYYRKIKDRLGSTVEREQIGGIEYNIYRPRNIGSADLKGIEVAGQVFLDFLPGALGGLGAFGNFTIADSKVTTAGDNLKGYALPGVSKYSYNAGALYEKYGIIGRLVYTWRSTQIGYDLTLAQDVRPVDDLVYLNNNRPLGRLDFSLGYNITKNILLSVDGTNILNGRTRSYRAYQGRTLLPRDVSLDDSSYSVGVIFTF